MNIVSWSNMQQWSIPINICEKLNKKIKSWRKLQNIHTYQWHLVIPSSNHLSWAEILEQHKVNNLTKDEQYFLEFHSKWGQTQCLLWLFCAWKILPLFYSENKEKYVNLEIRNWTVIKSTSEICIKIGVENDKYFWNPYSFILKT